MKRGRLTWLIKRLLKQYPKLQNDPTLLYLALCKVTQSAGYRPNAASVVRIYYRLKQHNRRGY